MVPARIRAQPAELALDRRAHAPPPVLHIDELVLDLAGAPCSANIQLYEFLPKPEKTQGFRALVVRWYLHRVRPSDLV